MGRLDNFKEGIKERAVMLKDNTADLLKTSNSEIAERFKEKDIVGVIGGTAVKIFDVLTRAGDVAIQSVANKRVEAPNAVGDLKRVGGGAVGTVKNVVTLHPIKAVGDAASAISSGFQTLQSAAVQVGHNIFGTTDQTRKSAMAVVNR